MRVKSLVANVCLLRIRVRLVESLDLRHDLPPWLLPFLLRRGLLLILCLCVFDVLSLLYRRHGRKCRLDECRDVMSLGARGCILVMRSEARRPRKAGFI
jgi:hypothetical protein